MSAEPQRFDDPDLVAAAIVGSRFPVLLATDVDGTLSPIVESPHQAQLVAGAGAVLDALAAADGVDVAVVSGRSLRELKDQFGLSADLHLVGSHGAEVQHTAPPDAVERAALAEVIGELEWIAASIPGARVERKPLAGALHVRSCTTADAKEGLRRARTLFAGRVELAVHEGHQVYEVAIRQTNKAAAVLEMRTQLQPATVVFFGDDTSDETAFEVLRPPDIGIKVGQGATVARYRLASPHHVLHVLTSVASTLALQRRPPR